MVTLSSLKEEIAKTQRGYKVTHRNLDENDFGTSDEWEFDSSKRSFVITLHSKGWIEILVWNKITERVELNTMLSTEEDDNVQSALKQLRELIIS